MFEVFITILRFLIIDGCTQILNQKQIKNPSFYYYLHYNVITVQIEIERKNNTVEKYNNMKIIGTYL